jgi:hypothetical protein
MSGERSSLKRQRQAQENDVCVMPHIGKSFSGYRDQKACSLCYEGTLARIFITAHLFLVTVY